MTMLVLQDKQQYAAARKELIKMGASSVDSPLQSRLRRLHLIRGVAVGDDCKSWDVLSTLKFIQEHAKNDEPILDIGCYASEVVVALHKIGYTNVTGVDLSPNLKRMPYQESIRYEMGNFMHAPFADASFKAITAISVIEHGFDGHSLLSEMSRLLKPGGYFIASFDYWPKKIDTTGIKFFGMEWRIFSKEEVADFIADAGRYGLFPSGELAFASKESAIECVGKNYTFGWLVFRKVS